MKMAIILRKDLGMSTGKLVAQACHACLGSYERASKKSVKEWELMGAKKVSLTCDSLKELKTLEAKARKLKIPHFLVTDAGHTELPSGTITCLGVGPARDEEVDKVTGSLSLL